MRSDYEDSNCMNSSENGPSVKTSTFNRLMAYLVFGVALFMALTGIVNSAPKFWIIPSVGPFDSQLIRPIILSCSVFIVLATKGLHEHSAKCIHQNFGSGGGWICCCSGWLCGVSIGTMWMFEKSKRPSSILVSFILSWRW